MKKTPEHLSRGRRWIRISPWVILGSFVVMVPIFVFITLESINSQKTSMVLLLSEKGDALIRSFEAGTRTGMMGMNWSGAQVQRLIMETAEQPDILYILITDKDGRIVAHNQPLVIGRTHGQNLDHDTMGGRRIAWRIITLENGSSVFEVYRRFNPSGGRIFYPGQRMFPQDWFSPHMIPENMKPPSQTIYVGLAMAPIEQIIKENIRQKIVVAVILLMYGLLGIVSIFIAQNYRMTRASLSRIKAYSDTIVNSMPIGLIFIGEDAKIAAVNETSQNLLMISAPEVIGKPARDMLPQQIIDLMRPSRTRRDIITRDITTPVGGKSLLLEASLSTLRDDENHFLGNIILLRDISEIEGLKKEIQRKERLASLGSLAAGIAHEINNPLSSIKGFATYFKERYRDVPEDQKTADIMIGEVERLNRVIGQLLEFARPMDIRRRETSLGELISDSLEIISRQAEEKHVTIHTDGIPREPVLAHLD
ncbi:MAG: histidine kinase dimerization/phospho-acceptor domain-containing protein, partial [Desulfomonilia bacterium]|nr:histidine kinase dimerization/phospho-acceptor domain-containing protein [Desulfomonilia bacterium]